MHPSCAAWFQPGSSLLLLLLLLQLLPVLLLPELIA
jgi:hypothetical protein